MIQYAMQKCVVQSRWVQPHPDRRALSEVSIQAPIRYRLWAILPAFSAQLSTYRKQLCGLQARHDSAGADWLEIVEHSCMSKICMVGLNQTRGELPHKSLGGRLDQREMGCNWFASEFYCRVSRCADKQTWDFERATAAGRVRSAETFFFRRFGPLRGRR